jgi:hypothetical protein
MRAAMALLAVAAVLVSLAGHLACADDDAVGVGMAAAQMLEKGPCTPGGDHGAPIHCHCVCHGFVQASSILASSPVDFTEPAYVAHVELLPREASGRAPFEPPRA